MKKSKYELSFLISAIAPMMLRLGDDNGGGEGGGGEGGGDEKVSKADLDKALASVAALESKNAEILNESKKYKESLKNWEGLDPEKVKGLMTQLEENEEMKLLAEGKTSEVINKRMEKLESKHAAELKALQDKLGGASEESTKYKSQVRDLLIDTKVVGEFRKAKGLESASDDIVARAQRVFTVEDGEVVARGSDGKLITGKEGPLTITEWVSGLIENAPHLFEGSQGTGAQGNRSGAAATDIERRMQAASKAGDVAEYRRLKGVLEESRKKK